MPEPLDFNSANMADAPGGLDLRCRSRAVLSGDEIEDRVIIEHQGRGAACEGGGSEYQRRTEGSAARFLAHHLADVIALETVDLHRAVAVTRVMIIG